MMYGLLSLLLPLVLLGVIRSDPLNVHIVPHTHDDVGWLKTPDEYYYGANSSIQNAGVQYILDTVIMALQANPDRKFIYVEMAFFFRWWREQSSDTQDIVKNLVKSGQLEFINGGWTMHDEACVHFEDMVDQMTLGHQFLYNTFGIVPKIGWQLDPFGHSSTSAILNYYAGFEALFFARMDYQDLANREIDKGLEMTWTPSASLPNISILTGMMHGGYCNPTGFMFEYGDEPIQDDPLLEDFNLYQRAEDLMGIINYQASLMRHNDVMLSWGCDFMYQNAHMMYKNMEKLMNYINSNSSYNVKLFYSTPSIYAEAILTANPSLPTKTDDFMPYADDPHSYWSGYFTSRSTLKGFVRYSSHLLHALTSLLSTSQLQDASLLSLLSSVQQPNGVTTHHDAVSGTEQQHVADDYAKNLNIANTNAYEMFSQIYGTIAGGGKTAAPTFSFCPLLNESICPPTTSISSGVLPVVIYNPLSWANTDYVKLPVSVSSVSVADSNNNPVSVQVLPAVNNTYHAVFPAIVAAMGFSTYFVTLGSSSSEYTEVSSVRTLKPNAAAGITISNEYLTVLMDQYGNIQSVSDNNGLTLQIQQAYQYYVSNPGDSVSGQASGAYIFRPAVQESYPFNTVPQPQVTVINGSFVSEVRRYFQADLSQVIRLYAGQNYIEIEDIIGPINISDGKGKEVITRYNTSLNTGNIWYSDTNGIELIQRKLNYRPSWNYEITEPIAGNYVPLNAIASVKDVSQALQLSVVVDRSRSCASLSNGELETMLHRRCLVDDQRGVGEPLNETTVMYSKHWLVFSNTSTAASQYRPLAKKAYHPFFLAFGPVTTYATWSGQYVVDYTPLGLTVPPNVQILNFVPLASGEYILRLHHIYQVDEDATLSLPVSFDISTLLHGFSIFSIKETQLTAVAKVARADAIRIESDSPIKEIDVTLLPTEIRTFVISTKARETTTALHPTFPNPSSIHIV